MTVKIRVIKLIYLIFFISFATMLSSCRSKGHILSIDFPNAIINSRFEIPKAVSRTTGAAPLSVFFTAGFSNSSPSNREFHDLEYSWDFGDVSSGSWPISGKSKNSDKGPVASHLFEKAGTYIVSLSVRNASGIVDTDTFTISVTDPNDIFSGTKTTCLSDLSNNNFEGCPAEANQVTTDNISGMASYLGSGRRVLFHRGSVWSHSGRITFSESTTVQIGAYGNCQSPDSQGICSNAPHINLSGSDGLFDIDNMHDMRIADVNVSGNSTAGGVVNGSIDIQQLLVLRVKTTGHENAISWSKWRENSSHKIIGNSVISCNFSETESNIVFIGSEELSFMGNVVADSKAGHAVRVWFAYQGVISHNVISGADYISGGGLHALKFHGMTESGIGTFEETGKSGLPYRTKFTMVSNNVFGGSGPWPVSIGPQSARDVYDERLSDIIVEKNKMLSLYGRQTPKPVQKGLKIAGRYFTARNNVIDGTGGANSYTGIDVARRGSEAAPLGNHVYNNTIYRGDVATSKAVGVEVDGSADDTIIRNNFVSFPLTHNQMSVGDYSGNAIVDHNIISDSHGFVDPNNSNSLLKNFSLISSSPAINQGTNVPVLDDFLGMERVGTYTIGSYHR